MAMRMGTLARECGNVTLPSAKTVTFEVAWAEMIRALPAGTGFDTGIQNSDVSKWLGHLRIYVFSDLQTERFMCPSGVNAMLNETDAIEAGLGTISRYEDKVGSGSVLPRE